MDEELWREADGDYQVLPPLADAEFEELKADIAERGVLVQIEFDEDGNILDGHHRMRACLELGIVDFPRVVRVGLSEVEKRTHARKLNTARRHLSREQKRSLIADEIRENPSVSNNQIAKRLGVSDTTVGSVRDDMGLSAYERVGADGKTYSTRTVAAPKRRPVHTSRLVFDSHEDAVKWRRLLRKLPGDGTKASNLLALVTAVLDEDDDP